MAESPCEIPDYINYPLPDYIKYLLLPSTPLDFHAVVGNSSTSTEERIGVMKWMLIARSEVLRVMLLESELRPEKEFKDSELDPATFRHFLVFMYGHDNTSVLTFEDSVKLLSAAEKYNVPDLKCKLGEVIKSKVTPENVFIVLKNGPVCEKEPSLWEKVTEIIQEETEAVFGASQFLDTPPEVVIHILQQDSLSVPEIDIWRAARKWAEHQVISQHGKVSPEFLKAILRPLLKHIRVCTLSYEQLCREVFPINILSKKEILNICTSLNKQEKNESLFHVCNEIETRNSEIIREIKIFENSTNCGYGGCNSYLYIKPKNKKIKLYSAVFKNLENRPGHQGYQYKGKITISDQIKPTLEISFNEIVENSKEYSVPLKFNGRFIELNANVQYKMNFAFETNSFIWANGRQVTDHADCKFTQGFYCQNTGYYCCHLRILKYMVL